MICTFASQLSFGATLGLVIYPPIAGALLIMGAYLAEKILSGLFPNRKGEK